MRPWHAVGLFCDDIREEKRGDSLMGIWPDNLNVSAIPGAMPRLGMYVRIHIDPTVANIGAVSVKLRLPDDEDFPLGEFNADALKKFQADSRAKGSPWTGLLFRAVTRNLQIKKAGRMILLVKIGDEELVCGSLNIQLGPQTNPSSTASAPPA